MINDNELIYLYFQGNDDIYYELYDKYQPLLVAKINKYRFRFSKMIYDEDDLRYQADEAFMKSIYWYSESKPAKFYTFLDNNLEYAFKNYGRKLFRHGLTETPFNEMAISNQMVPKYEEKFYANKAAALIKYEQFQDTYMEMVNHLKGREKEIALLLLSGYNVHEIVELTSYSHKSVANAIFRVRKKLRKFF